MNELLQSLLEIKALTFGNYTLKSGVPSPIYFDLRLIISHPKILSDVSDTLWDLVSSKHPKLICGVPYAALPIASVISVKKDVPMIIRRKEAKYHGTKKLIEGNYLEGQTCLIIEDVITTGSSVLETALDLKRLGLVVTDVVVLVDRNQGGRDNLLENKIETHSVFNLKNMVKDLHKTGKISDGLKSEVEAFLEKNNSLPTTIQTVTQSLSYEDKLFQCIHPIGKRLLQIILKKDTNLCLSADVDNSQELLKMAAEIGPHICMLKIHSDALEDFDKDCKEKLKSLSKELEFLIMEDRKFGDTGNTVEKQLTRGPHSPIFDWADLVTVHALPGPAMLKTIKDVIDNKHGGNGGCVIVAEMSSEKNLTDVNYIKKCKEMVKSEGDCVVGFVSQSRVTEDSHFLHFTPSDNTVRRNNSDEATITKEFCGDVFIVESVDVKVDMSKVMEYKYRCMNSYKKAFAIKE